MSQAGLIDGFQFARIAGEIRGELNQLNLPRLAESQCAAALVAFVLSGATDPEGRSVLRISVNGSLRLVCQRCMGPVEVPLQVDSQLILARSEREIAEAEDDLDRVVASESMDVAALVEDEILLALPIAPRHERCDVAALSQLKKPSPFAALKNWKR